MEVAVTFNRTDVDAVNKKKKKNRQALLIPAPKSVTDTFLRNNWTKIKMHSFQSAETC